MNTQKTRKPQTNATTVQDLWVYADMLIRTGRGGDLAANHFSLPSKALEKNNESIHGNDDFAALEKSFRQSHEELQRALRVAHLFLGTNETPSLQSLLDNLRQISHDQKVILDGLRGPSGSKDKTHPEISDGASTAVADEYKSSSSKRRTPAGLS